MADNGGFAAQFPLEQWFYEMPFCTRWWTFSVVLTAVLVQCKVVTVFDLFYSWNSIFHKGQYWRLVTGFLYMGGLNTDLLFHLFFLQRYSRLIEESSGRSPARFSWLLMFSGSLMVFVFAPMLHLTFLGQSVSTVLVYIWGRRNPDTLLSFLGILTFRAPWLPWVLMAFAYVMHGTVPREDLCGVAIGHVWYYMNDIYPRLNRGSRPLDPPRFWVRFWEAAPEEDPVDTEEEIRGGENHGRPLQDLPAGIPI